MGTLSLDGKNVDNEYTSSGGISALTEVYAQFWNTAVWCGITPSPAICLTILKQYKSELCVLSTLDKHTKKHYRWLAAQGWTLGAKISVWRPWCRYLKVATSRNIWPRPGHANIIIPLEPRITRHCISVEQNVLRILFFWIQYPRLTRNRQIMLIETHF